MKRLIALTLACCFLSIAAVPQVPAAAALPGGKNDVAVDDPAVIEAAKFACRTQEAAMQAKGKKEALSLVKVVKAQSQVVAGISYTLTLEVKVGDAQKTAEAVVWVREWLKGDERIQLTSWKFQGEKEK